MFDEGKVKIRVLPKEKKNMDPETVSIRIYDGKNLIAEAKGTEGKSIRIPLGDFASIVSGQSGSL